MQKATWVFTFLVFFTSVHSQNHQIYLWPTGEIPNALTQENLEEIRDENIIRIAKVTVPMIEVYLPSKRNSTGQAVVICPGGGYGILAYDWEGHDIARYFNGQGIAAVVLKYRIPHAETSKIPHISPLMDAQRALRITRSHAADWSIDPNQIGIMGFSAGGHLAATLSTQFDRKVYDPMDEMDAISARPDFSILVYPVVSFSNHPHQGSRRNLLINHETEELIEQYSNEKQVTPETPPAILIHSTDDKSVPVENTLQYYDALRTANVEADVLIYPYGGHGYSLAIGQGRLSGWIDRVTEWIFDRNQKE